MPRTIMPSFASFPGEAAIIANLLAGYADLEVGLLNAVQIIRDDMDAVLKTMFRVRGETNRIDIADGLGRNYYAQNGLGSQFALAIGAMRFCLKIRNQYSHCTWWQNAGKLAFANLEEVAKLDVWVGSLASLTAYHVDVPFLRTQEAYFIYADDLMTWVNLEGQLRADKVSKNPYREPPEMQRPQLRIP
jgi:hypothetical protein